MFIVTSCCLAVQALKLTFCVCIKGDRLRLSVGVQMFFFVAYDNGI